MRILLLEDDSRIARDITATLAAAGYSVEHQTDGEEGWFKGDTEDYDAIVLDPARRCWTASPSSSGGARTAGPCPC